MSIEGGARCGYVNPTDDDRLSARPAVRAGGRGFESAATGGSRRDRARARRSTTSSASTAAAIEPVVTWGINPGMSVGVSQRIHARLRARARALDFARRSRT
jgi:3-isopropylmalate/(R)-2-methylmalate dehydratase large subunit